MSTSGRSESSEWVSNGPRAAFKFKTTMVEIDPDSPTVNFILFPKLPTEMRLKVWKIVANETRNIDIWVRNLYITPVDGGQSFWAPYYLYTGAKVPAVLHTSHESRVEGLKHYTLDFGTQFRYPRSYHNYSYPAVEVRFQPQIYINWEVDRLCLMRPEDFQEYITTDGNESKETKRIETFVEKCTSTKLRRLAVNVINPDIDLWSFDSATMDFPYFTDLVPRGGHIEELVLFRDDQWGELNGDFDWDKRKVKGEFDFEDVEVKEDDNELASLDEWAVLDAAQSSFVAKLRILFAEDHHKMKRDDLILIIEEFQEAIDFRYCKVEYSTPQTFEPNVNRR
ncbi:hypothetical protein BKA64DRAFT_749993 [Cadophora sp. MPI-SDFR-AT-0126]|nr:hypothetical protein BKA64DRAFT_749993 [Leotiomycetes sp. MPI-SDFR-AT-0126]